MAVTLLFGTHNANKVRELQALVDRMASVLSIKIISLSDIQLTLTAEEDGDTFESNALKKAIAYATQSGVITVSDDSGLVIPSLNGDPGVHSARYGGEGSTYPGKMALILDRLNGFPTEKRVAYFECVLAFATPGGTTQITHGRCHGHIATEPKGNGGFGYDPIFVPDGFSETLAELPLSTKNTLSHRAKAFEQLIARLPTLLAD